MHTHIQNYHGKVNFSYSAYVLKFDKKMPWNVVEILDFVGLANARRRITHFLKIFVGFQNESRQLNHNIIETILKMYKGWKDPQAIKG